MRRSRGRSSCRRSASSAAAQRRLQRARRDRFDARVADVGRATRRRSAAMRSSTLSRALRAACALRSGRSRLGDLRQHGEQRRFGAREPRRGLARDTPTTPLRRLRSCRRTARDRDRASGSRAWTDALRAAARAASASACRTRCAACRRGCARPASSASSRRRRAAMHDRLTDRARDRERIHAGMLVEPAVFVGQQRFDVERRDVFGLSG